MATTSETPAPYYQAIQNHQKAQVLLCALELDIFSNLNTPSTGSKLSAKLNLPAKNLELLLMTLTECGYLWKDGETYGNPLSTQLFLSRSSERYIGEALLFREKMTSLSSLSEKLKNPFSFPDAPYDFAELARVSSSELRNGRIASFLQEMARLYPDHEDPLRLLDLGGGSGILALEFAKSYPLSNAVVFDTEQVMGVTKSFIDHYHLGDRVSPLAGDFNHDDIGGPFDIILASGVLNFVEGDLNLFIKKLSYSVTEGGYMIVIGKLADNDDDIPTNMLGWLSGFLDGVPLPISNATLQKACLQADLYPCGAWGDALFQGQYFQKKTPCVVQSDEIIQAFIELTENISNTKINVLNFGNDDMTFYRGEIHLIKMIGDFPGIHSAHLARKFGITRPVIHKTLQKLEGRGLVEKTPDTADKKISRLSLTKKGLIAYELHQQYHQKNDQELFTYLSALDEKQLTSIKGFLCRALKVIENHA